tara:strand:- start:1221 stop:2210 length:990 start_codon:yes stop_codon:yes gene_type:complete
MGSFSEALIVPLISLLFAFINPGDLTPEVKKRIFETSFNTVITGLRAVGMRATYENIEMNESGDYIEAQNIVLSYPVSTLNYSTCISNNYKKDVSQFPLSENNLNDCNINFKIESLKIQNLGMSRKKKESVILILDNFEFDLKTLSKIDSENMAAFDLISSVISEDQKVKGSFEIENGYKFSSNESLLRFKINLENLAELEVLTDISNLALGSFDDFDDFENISFELNKFELTYKDSGLRKIIDFFALSQLGQKISSELFPDLKYENEKDIQKLNVIKNFLDGSNEINCSRNTSIFFSPSMYEEMADRGLINFSDPIQFVNFFCEELKG